MKFIKKINEFFGQEEEIERDDIFAGDEEEGDFSFDEKEEGHDEEEDDFSHEEENWGDEESSSLGTSRISSFNDYSFDEPSFDETEGNLANKDLEDEMANFNFKNDDEDNCDTCEHDDEDKGGLDSPETDETSFVESFKMFTEKKASPAQLAARKAFADKMKGKKSDDKEDKEDKKSKEDKESDKEGKTPKTKKEKEFAALAEPKDKITFADKIAGAKKSKKK